MRVMGISGMPGSGKATVSELAAENGTITVVMGDIIREEAKKRGEPTKETAINLRKEHGEYIVAELTIKKVKKLIDDGFDSSIIIDGIRSPYEVDLFKENFEDFIVLSIFANPQIRFERIKLRQREDDTTDYEVFAQRDRNELGFGIGSVISLSDKMIINESDMESYEKKVREFIEEYDI